LLLLLRKGEGSAGMGDHFSPSGHNGGRSGKVG
jgi:hypothetical protein